MQLQLALQNNIVNPNKYIYIMSHGFDFRRLLYEFFIANNLNILFSICITKQSYLLLNRINNFLIIFIIENALSIIA